MDYSKTLIVGKIEGMRAGDKDGEKQVFFSLVSKVNMFGADGQRVDKVIKHPMYSTGNQANAIAQYVGDGHEILVEAQYINWEVEGTPHHIFKVVQVQFGRGPARRDDQGGGQQGDGMPPL